MFGHIEPSIAVLAQFVTKANTFDAFMHELQEMMSLTTYEPGCSRCSIYQDLDNPLVVTIVERFDSQHAWEVHRDMQHTRHLLERAPDLVESYSITYHKEVPVKELDLPWS